MRKRGIVVVSAILSLLLLASVGLNIYLFVDLRDYQNYIVSYLQNTNQIYVMESGILKNNLEFADGKNISFEYDFNNEEYPQLIEKYGIDRIAGNGTEFEKAKNLMNEYAGRLTHKSDYDNSIVANAVSLLEYSLDNGKHGINCKAKSQILNEMCLALNIYSRKVWLMPNSEYDGDCHVVNEIWDSKLSKWIMLDITHNQYWVDENGTPLSILEIRTKGALQEFCTPVTVGDSLDDLQQLKNKNLYSFLYIMKNMYRTVYLDRYTVGDERTAYLLIPESFNTDYENIISQKSCEKSPIE